MTRPIRTLLVFDSEEDMAQVLRHLRLGGYDPVFTRAGTAEEVGRALGQQRWDVVIADASLKELSLETVLGLLGEKSFDLPVVVVSDQTTEQLIVEAIKAGAYDYIRKDNLGQLALSLEMALPEAELKRKQREAEEESERLRRQNTLILLSVGEGIFSLDEEGRITLANPAAEKMTLWSAKDMIGQPLCELVHNMRADRSVYPPEECPIQTTLKSGVAKTVTDEVFWRRDGTFFPVEYVSTPIKDNLGAVKGAVVSFRDTTKRKEAEESLRETKQYLSSLIQSSTDAVISTDREGNIAFFSGGAEALLGYESQEVLGRYVTVLYESEELAKEVMRRMRDGGGKVSAHETTLRTKDGGLIPVLISASILYDEDGQEAGTVGFNKDMRERKRAEEELRESRDYLYAVANSIQDGLVVIEKDFTISFANEAYALQTGRALEDIIGHSCHLVAHHHEERCQDPDYECPLNTVYGLGRPKVAVHRHLDEAGGEYWTEVSGSPMFDERGEVVRAIEVIRDITARKKAEDALVKTKLYLDSLIESSPVAIITSDRSGTVRFFSPGAEALLGYRKEDVIGRHVTMLYESEEHAREVLHQIRERGGKVITHETNLRSRDGSLVPVLISASLLYDEEGAEAGVVGFSKDLRERKRQEELIKKLSRAVEQSPSSVVITDAKGDIEYVNPKFSELTGYSLKEVVGLNPRILKSGEQADEFYRELWKTITLDGEWRGEFHNKKKSGESYWEFASISPIRDGGGNITHFIAIKEDITDRKRSEQKLRKAFEEVQQAYEKLERAQASVVASEKLAALGRLTAGVSHEILNPLNIITLRLYMLIHDAGLPAKTVEELKTIEEQANRITKISQDLLYYARQRPPERKPFNLNDAIARTVDLLAYELRKSNISTELDLLEGLPEIEADLDQIQQVILNLLNNSRDAMPEGGRIRIETRALDAGGAGAVLMRFEDDGVGMDLETKSKLFDPFYTTKTEGKGTGMGLSICQGIIHSHGGTIEVESESGQGTAFTVRFPL